MDIRRSKNTLHYTNVDTKRCGSRFFFNNLAAWQTMTCTLTCQQCGTFEAIAVWQLSLMEQERSSPVHFGKIEIAFWGFPTRMVYLYNAEPGVHRRNEDSRGNDNRKLWKNVFHGKKNDKHTFFFNSLSVQTNKCTQNWYSSWILGC